MSLANKKIAYFISCKEFVEREYLTAIFQDTLYDRLSAYRIVIRYKRAHHALRLTAVHATGMAPATFPHIYLLRIARIKYEMSPRGIVHLTGSRDVVVVATLLAPIVTNRRARAICVGDAFLI